MSEFVAGENGALGHAALVNTETGEEREIPVSGTFVAVGHEPQSSLVAGQIDVDENGYVITEGRSTRTNRPGVFAAGDLVDHTYRQAVTAAGSGCQAALDAEWYLRDTPGMPALEQHARRGPRPRRSGRLRPGRERALELQQIALAIQPAAIAAECAPGAQDAVAGDHDRDRVGPERVAGRTGAAWVTRPRPPPRRR